MVESTDASGSGGTRGLPMRGLVARMATRTTTLPLATATTERGITLISGEAPPRFADVVDSNSTPVVHSVSASSAPAVSDVHQHSSPLVYPETTHTETTHGSSSVTSATADVDPIIHNIVSKSPSSQAQTQTQIDADADASAPVTAKHQFSSPQRRLEKDFTLPELSEDQQVALARELSLETFRQGSLRQMSKQIRESMHRSLSDDSIRSSVGESSPTTSTSTSTSTAAASETSVKQRRQLERTGIKNMAKIWMQQSADSGLEVQEGLYQRYQTIESDDDEQISRDIGRTFAEIDVFKEKGAQESLRRVLHAFSCACNDPSCINNEELGYVQGMNFVAGFLLIMCSDEDGQPDEEAAFWLMVRLMVTRKYKIAGMFMEGMSGVFCAAEQLELVMEKKMKEIKKALDKCNIPTTAWLPQWILTLFAKEMGRIKPAAVQQIWNNIFKEGWCVEYNEMKNNLLHWSLSAVPIFLLYRIA